METEEDFFAAFGSSSNEQADEQPHESIVTNQPQESISAVPDLSSSVAGASNNFINSNLPSPEPTIHLHSISTPSPLDMLAEAAAANLNSPVPSTSSQNCLTDFSNHRKRAHEGLLKQAERMVKRSRKEHVAGSVGDNVTIPIPLFDRGRGDPRNLLGVIIDRDVTNDLYRIAVKSGILNGKFSRNQFDLCSQVLLSASDVSTEIEMSLREAVQLQSLCGGQGFTKCNCKGTSSCATNKCKCFKANLKCNSRCHSSLTCSNKN
jgi:hypothetical protein